MGEITVKITDGMHNLPKSIVADGVYPIISAQNIYDGKIDINTQKYVNEETFEAENKRTNISNGDVLLTIVGAIGRTAVVKDDLKALFQRSVCVIKPMHEVIESKYLKYSLDSRNV